MNSVKSWPLPGPCWRRPIDEPVCTLEHTGPCVGKAYCPHPSRLYLPHFFLLPIEWGISTGSIFQNNFCHVPPAYWEKELHTIVHSYWKWNRSYLTSLCFEIFMTSFEWCIEKDNILKSVFFVYFARFAEPRWYACRNHRAQVDKHFVITLSQMPVHRPCVDSDQPRHGGEREAGRASPHSVSLGSFQLSPNVFLKKYQSERVLIKSEKKISFVDEICI